MVFKFRYLRLKTWGKSQAVYSFTRTRTFSFVLEASIKLLFEVRLLGKISYENVSQLFGIFSSESFQRLQYFILLVIERNHYPLQIYLTSY